MAGTLMNVSQLQDFASRIRVQSLVAIYHARSGHPGGALSAADLLAYLFGSELPRSRPVWPAEDRYRFVLSKGHACPALYAAAANVGLDQGDTATLRKLGSPFQGHPHVGTTPWVEASTGSLGQGFSAALGMAMGLRYRRMASRVYAMLGDGELQEGEVWEAAMCAAQHKLDNLCVIVDYNRLQSDDHNENIMGLEPLADKWRSFNWHVLEIDGHDFDAIEMGFEQARSNRLRPTVIIANTKKGKGVAYMEDQPLWHGSVTLRESELIQALVDLGLSHSDAERYCEESIN